MTSHQATLSIEIGNEEFEVEIEFDFFQGYPATGPTGSCGGEPGCGPEITVTDAVLFREPSTPLETPKWLKEWLCVWAQENEYDRLVQVAEST